MAAAKPPLVSANQVTLLRLALMPLPCWLLFQGRGAQLAAVVIGTLIGVTDLVDGYLARKQGPTVLGGLMDPIADKVFLVTFYVPAVVRHWLPAWLVAALFVREFVVTAARTAYERRGKNLRSSYFARYKTWVQMCGAAVLVLLRVTAPRFMVAFFAVSAGIPIIAFAVRRIVRGKRWKGGSAYALSFASLLLVQRFFGSDATSLLLGYYILAITWASGLGYLLEVGRLRGTGGATLGEIGRLALAVLLPVLVVACEVAGRGPQWAIVLLLCVEMAQGGLDNLLGHHHTEQGALAWCVRLVAECGLAAIAYRAGGRLGAVALVSAALVGAAVLAAVSAQRRHYLAGRTGPVAAPGLGRHTAGRTVG